MIGNGNPVFFRDVNALAGDNGTPERVPGDVDPIHESGFPMLYDTKPGDINFQDRFELGGGLGVRFGDADSGLDVLGWYFQREMEDAARIRGTFYEGDLDLLRGVAFPLPFSGNDKHEAGGNLEARIAGLRLFAQYVDQEIASLPRDGFEVEAAYVISLNGLFAYKDASVGNWIQPVVRFSKMNTNWDTPREFPGPVGGLGLGEVGLRPPLRHRDRRRPDGGVRAGQGHRPHAHVPPRRVPGDAARVVLAAC